MILKNKGKSKKSIITLYGEIVYSRTLLVPVDKENAKTLAGLQKEKSVCPLDGYLGVDKLPFKMTVKMMTAVAKEAVRSTSYERAAVVIREHLGVEVSVSTVRNVTDFVGNAVYYDDKIQAENAVKNARVKIDRRKKHRKADDILYIEMDGAMFNTRSDNNGTSWMECKIGIAFHSKDLKIWTAKNGETRRQITKKKLVGYIGNYKVFKNHILALADQYGYKYCSRIVVISDGADWIHRLTEELFPDSVHILDLSHVKEHVSEYGKWLWNDEAKAEEWISNINEMIEESRIGEVLSLLEPYKDKKCPANVSNLYTYIQNHRECMDYKFYRQKGYFVGSGASESANKYTMQNRMKLQGMRWNKESGQNMLSLKTRLESNCWSEVEPLVKKYCNSMYDVKTD